MLLHSRGPRGGHLLGSKVLDSTLFFSAARRAKQSKVTYGNVKCCLHLQISYIYTEKS